MVDPFTLFRASSHISSIITESISLVHFSLFFLIEVLLADTIILYNAEI